ncbi:DUF58 domain-containing protein [Desulfosarcina ovata]|uniref:DUF58 domain-containing protein n=1 Tax=Desulfosarcina ovata subsp. ovata TaxID=2752305 RepID=A0A5K8ACR6_9BACT|nr:DUF58 domain-containing protein [Desulfosarcina ovata]BBO90316.1 DUF58 domain-containing protein [Desulfosarcina ovata subsp. ovata]
MLSPEIIKKIKKVHIKTGRMVNTIMAGQYRSIFRGAGIEFEEVREYTPGDDVKSIDWKVSARMGKPFIKRYREEREQVVMLLVDMSASGRFGTTDSVKRETAAEIAAILAFNAIRNNDKAGAILFTDQVERYIPPKKGSAHVWRLIREIFTFQPRHTGTDIVAAVDFLARVCRKRTVAFLVSDFLTERFDRSTTLRIRSAARKHELVSVLVTDPGEFHLPDGGIVALKDLETGAVRYLDAADRATRQRFQASRQAVHDRILDTHKAMDTDCIEMPTDGDAADALVRYFHYRERRRR